MAAVARGTQPWRRILRGARGEPLWFLRAKPRVDGVSALALLYFVVKEGWEAIQAARGVAADT